MTHAVCRQVAAVMLSLVLAPATVIAAEVTGQVTKVDGAMSVTITLADGAVVDPGDPVQILADIPGLGPIAIATLWTVDSFASGIAVASPQSPPTGTPQPGYTARIETDAVAVAQSGDQVPSPEAMSLYLSAEQLAASGDLAQAGSLYQQAADLGHPGAMTALGVMYSFGRGVQQDDAGALAWHRQSADLGNSRAMLRLGLIHMMGWGTPVSHETAAGWFHRAAESGNATGMLYLFLLYEDGTGVPKDFAQSLDWLKQAADNGHRLAQYYLGEAYLDGEDDILPKDTRAAQHYLLLAAEAGQTDAMKELAEFYEQRDPDAARKWSNAAREAGAIPAYLEDPRCLGPDECYRER